MGIFSYVQMQTISHRAAKLNCVGSPDLYNHYREARFTQTKHHWWWKANKWVIPSLITKYFDDNLFSVCEKLWRHIM